MGVIILDNILFVAVSQKMADTASRLIKDMRLNIPVVVSSEAESQNIALKYPNIGVFISRGRTASSLQHLTGKPTVEITSSINDILEPIQKLTATGIEKIAVLASPILIGDENYDYKFGNVDVFIRPYELDELQKLFPQIDRLGVKGVIGGTLAYNQAKKLGLKAELLETEAPSIKRAINEAVRIGKAQENERLREKEKAEMIHRYSSELYDALEEAAAAVEELTSSSEELAATSQETANIASTAFKEVNNTSVILEIIRRVAKQTNLLGLNAAIEASRAGEYGRGFTVVASEVRKLADESNTSARNIDAMLNKFRNSVESVLRNVEQSNLITQEQAKANQNIAQMLDNLRDVGGKLMEMAEKKF